MDGQRTERSNGSISQCEHIYRLPPPAKGVPALGRCKICGGERLHNNAPKELTRFGKPESHVLRPDIASLLGNW